MLPRFRRQSSEVSDPADAANTTEAVSETVSVAGARSRAYTPGKGKATPKRREAGRRTVEKPPANRREALKRMRQKQREERAEQRAGMMAGKEEYLPARDRGPERGLIRDLVDSRRNVASYFLIGLLIVIVGSSQAMPSVVRFGTNIFWLVLAVALIVDSILLGRKIKRTVRERYPKTTTRMGGNIAYGVMRSLSFRKWRIPGPRVTLGQKV